MFTDLPHRPKSSSKTKYASQDIGGGRAAAVVPLAGVVASAMERHLPRPGKRPAGQENAGDLHNSISGDGRRHKNAVPDMPQGPCPSRCVVGFKAHETGTLLVHVLTSYIHVGMAFSAHRVAALARLQFGVLTLNHAHLICYQVNCYICPQHLECQQEGQCAAVATLPEAAVAGAHSAAQTTAIGGC